MAQRKNYWLLAAALALACLMAAGAAAWSEGPPDAFPEPEALPVDVVRLESGERVGRRRTFAGTIRARRTSDLSFDQAGRLVEVLVDEGQAVRQGQPLARLDQRNLQARLDETAARRDAAQARLEELQAGPRPEVIAAARAEVAARKAQLQLLAANHRRSRELIHDGSVSQGQFDETSFGQAEAEAQLEAARQRLAELEAGTRREQLDAQRAAVAQLHSAFRDIQLDLEDSLLVAPFDGTIGARFADEGTVVAPGTPILRLVESDRLEVWIGLPVGAAQRLVDPSGGLVGADLAGADLAGADLVGADLVGAGLVGADAAAKGPADDRLQTPVWEVDVGGRRLPAKLQAVLPELDPATRTRTVVFQLENASRAAVPGQVARLDVTEQVESVGFWVPTAALQRGGRGLWSALVVPEPDAQSAAAVVRRDVEVLETDGGRSFVRGTLREGDLLVVHGTHRLAPGQRVHIAAIVAPESLTVDSHPSRASLPAAESSSSTGLAPRARATLPAAATGGGRP